MLRWASIFTGGIPKNRLVNSAQNACDRSLKHAIFDSGDAERAKFFGIARFWEYTLGASFQPRHQVGDLGIQLLPVGVHADAVYPWCSVRVHPLESLLEKVFREMMG